MPLHDHTGRLMYDSCAGSHYDAANKQIHGYLMRPHTASTQTTTAPTMEPIPVPTLAQSRDLAFDVDASKWMGYGLERSVIDRDSDLRMDQQMMTQHGEKTQMNVRTFHAVPNLSRGALLAVKESQLVHGAITTTDARNCRNECENAVELDFDRYDPSLMYTPVNVDNIVPKWTHGGASSRDISLSEAFQNNMQKLRGRKSTYSAHDPPAITAPQFARANEHATAAVHSAPSAYRRLRTIANQ
jgi:hypothetical protein